MYIPFPWCLCILYVTLLNKYMTVQNISTHLLGLGYIPSLDLYKLDRVFIVLVLFS